MTNQFELPVFITVKTSRWLKIWLYLVHLPAIPVIVMSNLIWPARSILIFAVSLSLYFSIRNYVLLRGRNSIVRIMLNDADEWRLSTGQGDTINATLLPAAMVHPLLVILPFRSQGGKYTVILTPDVINSDLLRRLRVRLKFPRSRE